MSLTFGLLSPFYDPFEFAFERPLFDFPRRYHPFGSNLNWFPFTSYSTPLVWRIVTPSLTSQAQKEEEKSPEKSTSQPSSESSQPTTNKSVQSLKPSLDYEKDDFNKLGAVRFSEDGGKTIIEVNLPGIEYSDIGLGFDTSRNCLILKVEKKFEETQESESQKITVSRQIKFTKNIPLKAGITASNISSDFNNGILKIEVLKPALTAPPPSITTIEINKPLVESISFPQKQSISAPAPAAEPQTTPAPSEPTTSTPVESNALENQPPTKAENEKDGVEVINTENSGTQM